MTKVMVHGSAGKLDYLAIARKGNLVLSVKPNHIAAGEQFNVQNLTYFGARLRSAPVGGAFKEADAEAGVTLFGNFNAGDAWGGIDWDKDDSDRASTQVGVFLRGSLATDPDKVLSEFVGGETTKKFADYLIAQAGDGVTAVATREEISEWLEATFAPRLKEIVESISKSKKAQAAFEKEIEGSVGVFANQTSLLKKIYKGSKLSDPSQIADKADSGDEAQDEHEDEQLPD